MYHLLKNFQLKWGNFKFGNIVRLQKRPLLIVLPENQQKKVKWCYFYEPERTQWFVVEARKLSVNIIRVASLAPWQMARRSSYGRCKNSQSRFTSHPTTFFARQDTKWIFSNDVCEVLTRKFNRVISLGIREVSMEYKANDAHMLAAELLWWRCNRFRR